MALNAADPSPPPGPPLSPEWRRALVEQAIADGLADPKRRALLMQDVPRAVVSGIQRHDNDADQLRSDLAALVRAHPAGHLVAWLRQAHVLTATMHRYWRARVEELTRVLPTAPVGPAQRTPDEAADWVGRLMAGAPLAVAARVRDFILAYCDGPTTPVPFGGRAPVLDRLERWFAAPGEQPIALLAAPTGRGKSAVVTRFVERLVERGERVAFHPVSIRFGTHTADAVLPALVGRLGALHGEPAPHGVESTDAIRIRLAQLLRRPAPDGGSLLVVIDGLDEAADWSAAGLVPRDLGRGVRVLLSQRHAFEDRLALLDRLELDRHRVVTPELPPLDRPAAGEVLASVAPDLAADVSLVDWLYALSDGGDPLVMRLLVDEWRRNGVEGWPDRTAIAATDLGLKGVWQRQVRRSEERAFADGGPSRALVAALATAIGALDRDDLLDLLAEDGVETTFDLERALVQVERFILRGQGGVGYVFCHARLREYVAEEWLGPRLRRHWQRRFVEWGQACIARGARTLMPAYVLDFYTAHLTLLTEAEGVDVEAWLPLLEDGWFCAWNERVDGIPGYLRDLHRVREALAADDRARVGRGEAPRHLVRLAHCALCEASVRDTAGMDLSLVINAVRFGVRSPAWAVAMVRARYGGPHGEGMATHHSERPWVPWVELLPDELLPDALDIAILRAERDRGRSDDILGALAGRMNAIERLLGLAWLDTLHEAIGLTHLMRTVRWYVEQDDAASITRWRRRLAAFAAGLEEPRRLFGRLDGLVECLGRDACLPLMERLAEVPTADTDLWGDATSRITLAGHMGGAPGHATAIDALRRVCHEVCDSSETPDVRAHRLNNALNELALRLPDRLDEALDVVREAGLMPQLLSSIPVGSDQQQNYFSGLPLVRSRLAPEEEARLVEERLGLGVSRVIDGQSADEAWAILDEFSVEQLCAWIETLPGPAVRRAARLQQLRRLPVEIVTEVFESIEPRRRHRYFRDLDLTQPAFGALALAQLKGIGSPRRVINACRSLAFALRDVQAEHVVDAAIEAAVTAWSQADLPPSVQLELAVSILEWCVPEVVGRWAVTWLKSATARDQHDAFRLDRTRLASHASSVGAAWRDAFHGYWSALPRSARLRANRMWSVSIRRDARLDALWAEDVRAGGDLRQRRALLTHRLGLADSTEPRRPIIEQQLDLARLISDDIAVLGALCRVGAHGDALERFVDGVLSLPGVEDRQPATQPGPAWFAERPAFAARRDALVRQLLIEAERQGALNRSYLWRNWAHMAPATEVAARRRAARASALAEVARLESTLKPWQNSSPETWKHDSSRGRLGPDEVDLDDLHEAVAAAQVLDAFEPNDHRYLLDVLPYGHGMGGWRRLYGFDEQDRVAAYSGVWRYAMQLEPIERGVQLAGIYAALPRTERTSLLDTVLDAHATEGRSNSKRSNGWAIAWQTAPDWTPEILPRVVDMIIGGNHPGQGLAVELLGERVPPKLRQAFYTRLRASAAELAEHMRFTLDLRLVAAPDGLPSDIVPDWRAGRRLPTNERRLLTRLAEVLPLAALDELAQGLLDNVCQYAGQHARQRIEPFGIVVAARLRRFPANGVPSWLFDGVVEALARVADSRGNVLTVLGYLAPVMKACTGADVQLGVALGACIVDAVRRWP